MKEARSKNRRIIIVPPDLRLLRGLLAQGDLSPGASWIYLGRDPLFRFSLEKLFEGRLDEIPIGQRLQALARETRSDYIEYIGELSSRFASLSWWLTSISEKNPLVSRLFLYSCYLRLILEDAKTGAGDRILVCETPGLQKASEKNLQGISGLRVENHSCWNVAGKNAGACLAAAAMKIVFIVAMTTRILIARIAAASGVMRDSGQGTVIFSWADDRSFSSPAGYRDVYCGTLGKEMMNRGEKVTYLVHILPGVLPTLPFLRGILALRRYEGSFLLFENLLPLTASFAAVFRTGWRMPVRGGIPFMDGLDVTEIIEEDLRRDRSSFAREKAFLGYMAGVTLAENHAFSIFIHPFENHAWEKMFSIALKKRSLSTKRVGYATSLIYPHWTSYCISTWERDHAPLPDIILVNGPQAKKVLVQSGFPDGMVLVGGFFRYPDFGSIKGERKGTPASRVLLALSPDLNEALELICTSIAALKNEGRITVIIKPHPLMKSNLLPPLIPALPPNFAFRKDPVDSLFPVTDLVIHTGSTVAVEAIARGIPVLHVRPTLTLDRDIFDLEGFPPFPSVMGPDELRRKAKEILSGPCELSPGERGISKQFFSPVDEGVLDELVQGRIFPPEGRDGGESRRAGDR